MVVLALGSWMALAGGSGSSPTKVATGPRRLGVLPDRSDVTPDGRPLRLPPCPHLRNAVGVTRSSSKIGRGPPRPAVTNRASSTRRLALTVRYPVAGTAGAAEAENAAAISSTFPVVVFAHGFAVSAATYAALERDLAAGGFIVVAPTSRCRSSAVPGPASQSDIDDQAHDVSFLIATFQARPDSPRAAWPHATGRPGSSAIRTADRATALLDSGKSGATTMNPPAARSRSRAA